MEIPSTIRWSEDGEALLLLDQTLLPTEERILRLETVESVAEAITSLRIRGAPAIGIAAAMGLALGLRRSHRIQPDLGEQAILDLFNEHRETLLKTRPTAVNLTWALDRVAQAFHEGASAGVGDRVRAVIHEADAIALEDLAMCRAIGEHGLKVIPEKGAGILTHCNAGALATGGMGTALAPMYLAHARGIPIRVYAGETRPLLQGARLTAWELARACISVTVVTDSMAGALMREGKVNLVMVGADRVAANGDVANKIGTYSLAVLAHHHGIPFYVALPRSTFDPTIADGTGIIIEQRIPAEVTEWGNRTIAPAEARVWNPAFDLTPSHLVTAFITDKGLIRPPYEGAISSLGSMSPEE